MPQIAIDLDKELDKIVRLYMVENDLSSKEKAIINIIKDSKGKKWWDYLNGAQRVVANVSKGIGVFQEMYPNLINVLDAKNIFQRNN